MLTSLLVSFSLSLLVSLFEVPAFDDKSEELSETAVGCMHSFTTAVGLDDRRPSCECMCGRAYIARWTSRLAVPRGRAANP